MASLSPVYGQVVVGPPGSGKTTYCNGMQQFLRLLGRDAWVVNMDPANEQQVQGTTTTTTTTAPENRDQPGIQEQQTTTPSQSQEEGIRLPYDTLFDVCEEAVDLSSVMEQMGLGPNGGLVYCMEYLEEHADEIIGKIRDGLLVRSSSAKRPPYLLLDFPGQVELYTHSTCVQNLLARLVKQLDMRLTAVQLIDAHYCTDAHKFLSAALLGTTTMIRLELPTVNVLSKVDLLAQYGQELPLDLDFFTECHDLDRLLPFLSSSHQQVCRADRIQNRNNGRPSTTTTTTSTELDFEDDYNDDDDDSILDDPDYCKARQKRQQSPWSRKYSKLHQALAEVVDDFGLLSFLPLDISSAESVGRVLAKIDKCNGYLFTTEAATVNEDLFQCAVQADNAADDYEAVADVRERVASPDSIRELARKK